MHCAREVHGDLSPKNVLLDEDDVPYLIDFGLAQSKGAGTRTTKKGCGTPGFMAPEIERGEDKTEYSDLFALGALLEGVMAKAPAWSGPESKSFMEGVVTPLKSGTPESRPTAARVSAELRELLTRVPSRKKPPPPWQRASAPREWSEWPSWSEWLVRHPMS